MMRAPFMQRFRQRGAAALMTLVFLLIVVGMAVVVALKMSGSDVYDTASQQNSVQALFLAESAMERTAQRLSGTACASLGTEVPIPLGSGTSGVVAPAPYVDAGLCRVRVAGTVGSVTRTVDAWFSSSGGGAIAMEAVNSNSSASAVNTLTVPLTVGGTGRVLVVGVTVDTAAGSAVTSVTYAGQPLTFRVGAGPSNRPRAEIWTLANPPAGSSNVIVNLSGNDQLAAGAMSFTGVDVSTATSHLDVAPVSVAANNGTTASVTITPVTNGAWLVDTGSINNGVTTSMTAMANRQQRWNIPIGSSITAVGSTLGPVSPAGARTLPWTWSGNRQWSQVAIALRPGSAPKVMQWTEVVQ